MLLILCLLLLLLALGGGYWGAPRYGAAWGWSPLGLVILVLVVLWLAGALPIR